MRMTNPLAKTSLLFLCLWASSACGGEAIPILAGPITNPANNRVYYLLGQNTWKNSQADAAILGGNLVSLLDAAENQWVLDTFASYGGIHRSLWIGLTDAAASGNFKWVDGEPFSYSNWAPTEPNMIGVEHFVYMFPRNRPDPVSQPVGYWNNYTDQSTEWHGASPIHGVVKLRPYTQPNHLPPLTGLKWIGAASYRSVLLLGLLSLLAGVGVGTVLLLALRKPRRPRDS